MEAPATTPTPCYRLWYRSGGTVPPWDRAGIAGSQASATVRVASGYDLDALAAA